MAKFKFEADGNEGAGQFTPVPEGDYVLGVSEVELKKTSTGKPMLKLTLTIDEGPFIGRKVWTNIVFNPKGEAGHGLTVQALKAFGFEYDGSLEIDTDDWKNRTCRARLEIESYEDKEGRDKKKNVIPTAGFITDDEPSKHQGSQAKTPAPSQAAQKVFAKKPVDVEEVPF